MAVTAYKNPGTLASVDNEKTKATTWTDVGNAGASDNAYATNTETITSHATYWIRATAFGFTDSDIPVGSTIGDIELVIERKADYDDATGYVYDDDVFLRKTAGQVGTDHATATHWPTSDGEATYTFTAADHGLTQTDVVSSGFGCDISAWLDYGTPPGITAFVDCIKIRVNYTAPPSGKPTHAEYYRRRRAA